MISTTYLVDGMTCGHCVSAVTDELTALDDVLAVAVVLATEGPSAVTVTSRGALTRQQVEDSLDEAGAYTLVGTSA